MLDLKGSAGPVCCLRQVYDPSSRTDACYFFSPKRSSGIVTLPPPQKAEEQGRSSVAEQGPTWADVLQLLGLPADKLAVRCSA